MEAWLERVPYGDRLGQLLPTSPTSQAVLVGVVAGLGVYLLVKKRYKLPPGPRGWPLLGNLLDFRNAATYEKLSEWATEYGACITFYMGPMRIVALNRIDVVMEALVKRQADFAGRPRSYSTDALSDGGKSILMGDHSATWKLHRRIASKALRYFMAGRRLENCIERSLDLTIDAIQEQKGVPVDPHDYMSFLVFNILYSMCFSKTYGMEHRMFKRMTHIADVFLETVGNGFLEDVIPPLRLFPTRKFRDIMTAMDEYLGYMDEEIVEHRATRSHDNMRDFTDAMLQAQEEAKSEEDPELLQSFTDMHVKQTLGDIFGAGIDTSRFTLLWTLLYLAAYPDVQEKLQQEVDQAMGSKRYPELSDRSNLPYTEAVLHECMRINGVAPTGAPHTTTCDTKIGNYDIPKGTVVMINHYALLHNPEQWGDPDVFRPERFLDSSGKMAPKPQSWLPFSAGRRVCLGESMAKPELHLLLAGIMRHFRVSLPKGASPNLKSHGGGVINIPHRYKIIMEGRA